MGQVLSMKSKQNLTSSDNNNKKIERDIKKANNKEIDKENYKAVDNVKLTNINNDNIFNIKHVSIEPINFEQDIEYILHIENAEFDEDAFSEDFL